MKQEQKQEISSTKTLEEGLIPPSDNLTDDLNLDGPAESDEEEGFVNQPAFDDALIKNYPKSNKKVPLFVSPYHIDAIEETTKIENNSQSLHISPHGFEFKTKEIFADGELVKIHVSLPNYWERKQKFVEYGRVNRPEHFKILGKVVKSEDVGKRGKQKLVTVQTIIIDAVDEEVLKHFLQDS